MTVLPKDRYPNWWICGEYLAETHYAIKITGYNPITIEAEAYYFKEFVAVSSYEEKKSTFYIKEETGDRQKYIDRALTKEEVFRYRRAWNLQ